MPRAVDRRADSNRGRRAGPCGPPRRRRAPSGGCAARGRGTSRGRSSRSVPCRWRRSSESREGSRDPARRRRRSSCRARRSARRRRERPRAGCRHFRRPARRPSRGSAPRLRSSSHQRYRRGCPTAPGSRRRSTDPRSVRGGRHTMAGRSQRPQTSRTARRSGSRPVLSPSHCCSRSNPAHTLPGTRWPMQRLSARELLVATGRGRSGGRRRRCLWLLRVACSGEVQV